MSRSWPQSVDRLSGRASGDPDGRWVGPTGSGHRHRRCQDALVEGSSRHSWALLSLALAARRETQYFRIRSATALRCSSVIARVRLTTGLAAFFLPRPTTLNGCTHLGRVPLHPAVTLWQARHAGPPPPGDRRNGIPVRTYLPAWTSHPPFGMCRRNWINPKATRSPEGRLRRIRNVVLSSRAIKTDPPRPVRWRSIGQHQGPCGRRVSARDSLPPGR